VLKSLVTVLKSLLEKVKKKIFFGRKFLSPVGNGAKTLGNGAKINEW
jgi:hypothetical protein